MGTIQTTQFSLGVQAPDQRFVARAVTLGGKALGDIVEQVLDHQRPVEWALRLDGGRLAGSQTGDADQRPQPTLTRQG